MVSKEKPRPAPPRTRRPDGETTRAHILETAGGLFAELGYEATTAKEICLKAGCNLASVNYHFGGRDGLYAEVLKEAHNRFISLDLLTEIANSPLDARGKLGRIIDGMLNGLHSEGWHLRVFMREIVAPSTMFDQVFNTRISPKLAIIRGLLSEITGISTEDQALARCFLSTFAPCSMLLVANRHTVSRVMADFWSADGELDFEDLKTHIKTFAFAGLDAVAAARRAKAAN